MRRFLWIAFLVLDTLVLVLFAAGYIARWVDPRTVWWPQLFAVALPLLSLSLLFATPVLAIAKRWFLFGLHLLFVVLIFVRFSAWGSATTTDARSEAESLRIASYNLGHFEIFSQAEQAQKLGEVLSLLYPDILGLQEFMVRYRGQELRIRNLPYVANKLDSLGFETVASQVHDVPTTFKPVWTRRGKLEQTEKQRIRIEEEGYAGTSVTRMEFNWQGRDAVYYNVHMRTFGSKKPWEEENMSPMSPRFWLFYLGQFKEAFVYRAWEAERVRTLIDGEQLPVILAGDFNSTPHNWVYTYLQEGLQDVHASIGPPWQTSYHVNLPLAKIDHMMVSPEWAVIDASISPLNYSDHRPLVAVLRWAE